jgi:hypothetical protein
MKLTAKATSRGEIHNKKSKVLVTVRHHWKLVNIDVSLMEGHDMIDNISP